MAPTTDLAEARRRQSETTEAARLRSIHSDLSVGGAHDVRPAATQASRGAVLEPLDLLDIKSTLISARTLVRFFERTSGVPALATIAAGLQPPPGVIDAISQTIDERGEVLDSASPALQAVRSELRHAHERLNTKLQRLVSDPKTVPMLQEPIITQRDGRYRHPAAGRVQGPHPGHRARSVGLRCHAVRRAAGRRRPEQRGARAASWRNGTKCAASWPQLSAVVGDQLRGDRCHGRRPGAA